MKKLRVFQAFKIKRIVPGSVPRNLGTVLLFLLLFPYIITFLFGNLKEGEAEGEEAEYREAFYGERIYVSNTTALGTENIPLEVYVADRLARSMNSSFETEALKAQAVLIRSGMIASLEASGENAAGIGEIKMQDIYYGSVPVPENVLAAVSETKGVYLAYEGKAVNGAYFAVSNGATRNGEELFGEEYPYLKSVPCSRDFLSAEYASSVSCRCSEFDQNWENINSFSITEEEILEKAGVKSEKELDDITLYRDSAGYVLYVEREGKYVSGEQFRDSFRLASASFHLNKEGGEILITVKGTGHGLGMSQFGANEMAKEGKDYVEILNYFFEHVTFTKSE